MIDFIEFTDRFELIDFLKSNNGFVIITINVLCNGNYLLIYKKED